MSGMVIQHNLAAMNASRQFGIVTGNKQKSAEKLSSGYRINRAADDAAGLAISEKMRLEIRGLRQGRDNLVDGVSFCQVADGALNEVHDMLNRLSELAVKGGNDTLTDEDHSYIQAEVEQLIDGMDDVFINTNFNEHYIFRAPFVPNVTGNPNDIQVFNSPRGVAGGVLIDHKRYTWNELGFETNPDGTFKDNSIKFNVSNNEEVELKTSNGDSLRDVKRVYTWSADNTGIKVNNVLAATWSDLGISDGNAAGTFSFNYHGMTISFTSEEDKLSDVIVGINGDGISEVSWQTNGPMTGTLRAVNMSYSESFNITNANKDHVHSSGPSYEVRADETGMWIHDLIHDTDTTKTSWASIATASGKYPISDWGRAEDSASSVTLDADETYTYIGNLSSTDSFNKEIRLTFTLMDEVSQSAVINALNGQRFSVSTSAPLTGTMSDGEGHSSTVYAQLSFEFQRDNGRNFDASAGSDAFSSAFAITASDRALVHHDPEEGAEEGDPGYDTFNGSISIEINGKVFKSAEFSGDTSNSDHVNGVTLYSVDDTNERITINNYYFAGSDQKIELKATNPRPYQYLSVSSNNTADTYTKYGVIVNPPKKKMDILASSDKNNLIEMEWQPLTTGILGIGGLLYTSSESCRANIDTVKAAQSVVSEVRSTFGAYQNRIEHSIRNNENILENTQAAESLIRDTQMDKEMVAFSNHSVLQQAGQTILAQANQTPQGVLQLLQ